MSFRPQLQQRNNAYDRWLPSGKGEDQMRFKTARNEAWKTITEVKNGQGTGGRR